MSIGGDDFVPMEAGDEDRGFGGGDEPMYGTSTHAQSGEAGAEEQNDVGELQVDSGMVEKPMMVQPPEVKYDTQIKVVDVRALKDKLWTNVEKKKEVRMSQLGEKQFAPNESLALRFICLLHLANEHNLVLEGSTGMDDIIVQHG
jgi:condensin complex subunit 2